jgi:long-chain acyl-CoA synthetase
MGNQGLVCGNFVGEKKAGESRILRNANKPELVKDFDGMSDLKEILLKNSIVLENKNFLGTREKKRKEDGTVELGEYHWINYKQVFKQSEGLARYLIHNNLTPRNEFADGKLRTLSLYAKNREEWVVTDMACILSDITVVTLYDTLGKDSIEYILDQTHIKTIVLSSDKIKTILELKKQGKISTLTHIIYMDDLNAADNEVAKELEVNQDWRRSC